MIPIIVEARQISNLWLSKDFWQVIHNCNTMSSVPLAHKYSPETYDQALLNLVERWKQEGGEDPIKYDEAAVGMDKSTVSVTLKFLGEIGLLDVPKAGNYIVPDEVLNYKTKMGDVKRGAKQEVAARLDDYPLYKETKFMLGLSDSPVTLDELAEDVSGTAAVAAEQDELSDVKRSLRVLSELEFLEIDEEGVVTIPAGLEGESQPESPEEGGDAGADAEKEAEGSEMSVQGPDRAPFQQPAVDGAAIVDAGAAVLTVEMDISMDVTDMGPDEIREKVEAVNGALGEE